jgi:hypothetical protein
MRHFLIFYTFTAKDGGRGYGEYCVSSEGFMNREIIVDAIRDSARREHRLCFWPTVVITNIIELSAEDVKKWLS